MDSPHQSLPEYFLQKTARYHQLSDLETEAFVIKLSNTEKHNRVIAKMLHISQERLRNRMTSIYRKFDIPPTKGAGKFRILLAKVMKIYEKESPENYATVEKSEIDKLVQDVHHRIRDSIDHSCRTMRVLDISQPICVEDIYTEVKILPQLSGNKHLDISDLTSDLFDPIKSSQYSEARQTGIDCIHQHHRLMILGKPGSGKTTLLKYMAVLCNQQSLLPDYLPFFIQLRDFAEQQPKVTLLDYFMAECHRNNIEAIDARQLLHHSRILFLLDGLDEVRDCDKWFVSQEIQKFANTARQNRVIVTCRLAAQDRLFEGFTDVEIADFNEDQIQFFAKRWFASHWISGRNSGATVQDFIQSLNQHIRIRELATNPLLLTLLCLVFDDSQGFPQNRSDLYVQSLDVLLKRWDANRGIVRSQAYESLSPRRKEDLLSQIAFETFSKNELFFRSRTTEQIIEQYIRNLPNSSDDPETLRLDSREVLTTIEIQHGLLLERARGIYSFSHLTFHEFFTARKIAKNSGPDVQHQALTHLAKHLTDPRWKEVFLLVLGMLDEADYLFGLMLTELQTILNRSEKFNQLFAYIEAKVETLSHPLTTARYRSQVREFYFVLATSKSMFSAHTKRPREIELDSSLMSTLKIVQNLQRYGVNPSVSGEAFEAAYQKYLTTLQQLHVLCLTYLESHSIQPLFAAAFEELVSPNTHNIAWWREQGACWLREFRRLLIQHRGIGHDWQFTSLELKASETYRDACKLMLACLNTDCYLQKEMRNTLLDGLFTGLGQPPLELDKSA